jgi:uncharacterized repeat protein (TIGR04076 family)
MTYEMPKCKITVLKRTLQQDLIDEYLEEAYQGTGKCERFSEGEEFLIDPIIVSEEFISRCPWAWADIRKDILTVAMGADVPGMKQPGVILGGCSDWCRTVIFKIERVENE